MTSKGSSAQMTYHVVKPFQKYKDPIPCGFSPTRVPLIPMYERGDIGGDFIREKHK